LQQGESYTTSWKENKGIQKGDSTRKEWQKSLIDQQVLTAVAFFLVKPILIEENILSIESYPMKKMPTISYDYIDPHIPFITSD
jgi:hypothetical protein